MSLPDPAVSTRRGAKVSESVSSGRADSDLVADDRSRGDESVADLGGRLRKVRLRSGLSLREVARQLGVSPSFVSQLETGKSRPSVATLYSLAQLLDISMDQLFGDEEGLPAEGRPVPDGRAGGKPPARPSAPPVARPAQGGATPISRSDLGSPADAWPRDPAAVRLDVTTPGDRARLVMDSGVIWDQLASNTGPDLDFIEMIYPPLSSSTSDSRMLRHEGFEYGYLLEGELEVTVGFEVFKLHAGEALGFDSSVPHLFRNQGKTTARGIWCVVHRHH